MAKIRRVIAFLFCLALLAIFADVAFGRYFDGLRYEDSKRICSALQPGMTLLQAHAAANYSGGRLQEVDESTAMARAIGWGMMCRCRVGVKGGNIVSVAQP